jgi:hypothetical protein
MQLLSTQHFRPPLPRIRLTVILIHQNSAHPQACSSCSFVLLALARGDSRRSKAKCRKPLHLDTKPRAALQTPGFLALEIHSERASWGILPSNVVTSYKFGMSNKPAGVQHQITSGSPAASYNRRESDNQQLAYLMLMTASIQRF